MTLTTSASWPSVARARARASNTAARASEAARRETTPPRPAAGSVSRAVPSAMPLRAAVKCGATFCIAGEATRSSVSPVHPSKQSPRAGAVMRGDTNAPIWCCPRPSLHMIVRSWVCFWRRPPRPVSRCLRADARAECFQRASKLRKAWIPVLVEAVRNCRWPGLASSRVAKAERPRPPAPMRVVSRAVPEHVRAGRRLRTGPRTSARIRPPPRRAHRPLFRTRRSRHRSSRPCTPCPACSARA